MHTDERMTTRELFAAMALQGMQSENPSTGLSPAILAGLCGADGRRLDRSIEGRENGIAMVGGRARE